MLKKPLFIAVFALLLPLISMGSLRTYLDHKVFYAPGSGPYLEVYVSFDGTTVAYAPTQAGLFKAEVEMTMILRQGDKIDDFRKLVISGPEIKADQFADFIDQQRFSVQNGDYDLELIFKDMNHPDTLSITHVEPIHIEMPESGLFFSDIELISKVSKSETPTEMSRNGYDLVPYISDYYPPEVTEMSFYTELYNSKQTLGDTGMFLLSYFIESFETGEKVEQFQKLERAKASEVNVMMSKMDISGLGSGNFNLVVEARNKENKLLRHKKIYFVRNNPQHFTLEELEAVQIQMTFVARIDNRDTIVEYINSLYPIAENHERNFINDEMKGMELPELKRYFYTFWVNRNSTEPDHEWLRYHSAVKEVNKFYGTRIKKGYDTDRGYVHLKYGAPNSVVNEAHEADAYPYQIWHYYKAGRYNNKRFVFYMPDLVTNDYELLHSEVPGEIHNERWNAIVHSRNTPMNNIGTKRSNSASGIQMDEDYALPR